MITVKTDEQIELMRESGKLTRDVLLLLEKEIRPGMTTKALDKLAYDFITSYGAIPSFLNYNGYPASICASIDEMVVHGIPKDDVYIREGQLVSIDVGVILNGWHGDAARTFAIGEVSVEKQKLLKVTKLQLLNQSLLLVANIGNGLNDQNGQVYIRNRLLDDIYHIVA